MWYLIVSIPDLCTFTYFHQFTCTSASRYQEYRIVGMAAAAAAVVVVVVVVVVVF